MSRISVSPSMVSSTIRGVLARYRVAAMLLWVPVHACAARPSALGELGALCGAPRRARSQRVERAQIVDPRRLVPRVDISTTVRHVVPFSLFVPPEISTATAYAGSARHRRSLRTGILGQPLDDGLGGRRDRMATRGVGHSG